MKKKLLSISFFLVGIAVFSMKRDQLPIILPIQNVTFNDASSAWIVTGKNDLLYTANGGETWNKIPADIVGGFEYTCFVTVQIGWAINKDGQVWKTTDSGKTWTSISKLDDKSLEQITFVDQKNGWIISPFSIWRTEDGGVIWKRHISSSPNRPKELTHRVYFLNSKVGWMGGENGAIYSTTDGGLSWEDKSIENSDMNLFDFFFLNERVGWVCGLPYGGIYHTQDGGKTWQLQKLPYDSTNIFSVYFTSEKDGWAVGSHKLEKPSQNSEYGGLVLRTTDAGKTWKFAQALESDLWCSRVYFANSLQGWIAGRNNVYRTDDGGKSWKRVLEAPEMR